jgi:hypothetical protein
MDTNADWGERFVRLALALEEHVPGFVDAYIGPKEWKADAKGQGKIALRELKAQVNEFVTDLSGTKDMDAQRRDYLARHLTAMQMLLRLLSGEKLSITEEAEALYDIRPQWKDESDLEEAYQTLDEVLPAGDSLRERMLVWQQSLEIPIEKIKELLPLVINRLHAIARKKFDLPDGDDFTVEFVSDQPWLAYNWYLGNFQSRIQINIDLPTRISELPVLIAHEAYPGHHTDLSIKEAKLVKGSKYYEFTVNLLYAPSSVMAEGIATTALKTALTNDELEGWFAEELLPAAGLSQTDAKRLLAIDNAEDRIGKIAGNAAFMLHDQNKSGEEISSYLQRYALVSEERAKHLVRFVSDPFSRSYIFTYDSGRDLLEELFQHGNRDQYFRRLIEEPVTPSLVSQWIKNSN